MISRVIKTNFAELTFITENQPLQEIIGEWANKTNK